MENVNTQPQHVSQSHENFIKDFIKTYKENRILWDKKHSKYKSRDHRDASFDVLLNKTNEYLPEANLDFVKTKIDGIRGAFRRERKKVLESKKIAKSDDDIYVPALWYYNLLLFLVGEETDEEFETNKDTAKHMYSWSKHHTVVLIDLLKKYPILYSLEAPASGSKSKRTRAFRDITNDLLTELGRNFEVYEVKNKINTLKQQFRRECRDRENKKLKKKSSRLWCYNLLMFLKHSSGPQKCESNIEDEQDISDDNTENLWINYELDSDSDKKDKHVYQEENQDDIFDTIGKNVAIKLRDMSDDQRIYAENLINEIMYHALMGNLNADSRIVLGEE